MMPFITVPGLKGKVYVPEKQRENAKKHPCKDCYSCQHCGDDRCRVCLGPQNPNCKKILIRKENDMIQKAFQDYYADEFATCYGCGRLNQHGLQIKSYWDGEESVCRFKPKPYHTGGFPGYVYGGLIASLIDCHGAGTASAAKSRYDGRNMETHPPFRFVTAALHVDYLAPTPIDEILELRGSVKEIKGRKVVVSVTLSASDKVCAKGEVIAVQIPE